MVNVEKSIHLVSTVMHKSLQNAIDNVDENLLEEVDSMVDELKQLSTALDVSISNEQQCDVDSDSKAKENSSADVASVSYSKNSRETENKVKGNKSRKKKKGKKGGSKR
ncbi:hypothetical protein SO802_011608 [Lithocarpus litseifolius]|uniref:Uncharacterized protein n=1 Tax=Lithocarpus litseifolius TaxID=425828 RepID=A0AAW2D149_9ROSI